MVDVDENFSHGTSISCLRRVRGRWGGRSRRRGARCGR
ncbi:hypothetical protein SFR_0362 [Streptomyces sp. FR-008]|nr:hypothetical protein SFR_0362 [Streptomyces sp. FR-008]